MELLLVGIFAFLGGVVQAITGFGCVIVEMLAFPRFFPMTVASGVGSTTSVFLSTSLFARNRKYVHFKSLIVPAIVYAVLAIVFIRYSVGMDKVLLKKIFGGFLIFLCIYNLFLNKNSGKKLSLPFSIFCWIFSGVCSGLFGIGGPLMALYFQSIYDDRNEFVGNCQCFFTITSIISLTTRIVSGILTVEHIPYILVGSLMIVLGGFAGSKIADRTNKNTLKIFTYIMVGISGLLNIFQ